MLGVPQQPLHRFKAEFFRALGHPARLRILELLRAGELSVTELQSELEIDASSVSQQLDVARDIFNNHLIDLQSMFETQARTDEQVNGRTGRPRRRKEVAAAR